MHHHANTAHAPAWQLVGWLLKPIAIVQYSACTRMAAGGMVVEANCYCALGLVDPRRYDMMSSIAYSHTSICTRAFYHHCWGHACGSVDRDVHLQPQVESMLCSPPLAFSDWTHINREEEEEKEEGVYSLC